MNKQTEALRLADALDADATNGDMGRKPDPKCYKRQAAIELRRLHQALAKQPAQPQQEPVAWMIWTHGPVLVFMNKDEANLEFDRLNHTYPAPTRMLVPLYTSPPASKPWVELSKDDIWEISCQTERDDHDEVIRLVTAKLKEKNT